MPLLLSDEDVRSLASMNGAMEALLRAFTEEADGEAITGERTNLMLPKGWIRLAAAAMPTRGILGFKEFHLTVGQGVRYSIQLYDYDLGHLLAILDGSHITALRTGATAGVALRFLAPQRVETVGVIGSGREARTQLEACAAVCPAVIRGIVFSPNRERRERFCNEMKKLLGLTLQPADSPDKVAEEADILLLATKTGDAGPVLRSSWLRAGMHITSVGSTLPGQREIDEQTWALADRIVLDTPTLVDESGDAIAASASGLIDATKIVQLVEVAAGRAPGRTDDAEITLYKSVGTPLQDIATAAYVYEQAQRIGVGRQIDDFQSLKGAR